MMTYLIAILLSLGLIGAYAILAVGIVMIYRASRVLNLAHGAMVMVPPYIVWVLSSGKIGLSLPVPAAIVAGLAAGGLLGLMVERFFVRPLRREGSTAQTVGTVAALGLIVAVAAKVFGTTTLPAARVFPAGAVKVGLSSIRYGEFGLFGVMIVVTAVLILLLQRTDIGLMMRGAAENRRAAALMGVNPDRMISLAWITGGTLAALSGIMLASITNLHPYVLSLQALPAFVAALIAGLTSLQGAVVGAGIVGTLMGLVPALPVLKELQGSRELILTAVALLVMATRGGRLTGADIRAEGGAISGGRPPGRSADARNALRISRRRRPWVLLGLTVFLAFPWVPSNIWFSILGSANDAARFTLVATSLVLLVGWVGQISLGHAALVGVGAYVTGQAAAGLGIPFPLSLPIAVAASAVIAGVIGAVAVRVRGLYLAVATLIFSWMADEFLFTQDWILGFGQIDQRSIGAGIYPLFDFRDRRIFYYVGWSVAIAGLLAAANLRNSKTGRAFFAVRGSEMAAASLGIDVVRTKLVAFAVSGALAGAAGNLLITHARVVNPESFSFNQSFFFLSIAVVGGLRSLGGGVAAAALFASLSVLFFRVPAFSGYLDVVSAGLLAVVLMTYREGLAQVPRSLSRLAAPAAGALARAAAPLRRLRPFFGSLWKLIALPFEAAGKGLASLVRGVRRSLRFPRGLRSGRRKAQASSAEVDAAPPPAVVPTEPSPAEVALERKPVAREQLTPLIGVEGLTVRFGGLTAVSDVSLSVREGEIVGLIGPNGAGKTVTFNSISGIVVPTSGTVRLYGREVTKTPVHRRAQLGLARTFQVIQLFSQLTVFDNLLVATHVHNHTGLWNHIVASEKSIRAELSSRERVSEVIDKLGLEDVAARQVAGLPFGALRMVEVARALVTGHKLIMLDEPASGLDNTETDRLSELLRLVRSLGVTLLLIEHDVKMVTSVSDYMYVLDRGELICEGSPETVKRDDRVISAYLGTPAGAVEEPVRAGAK